MAKAQKGIPSFTCACGDHCFSYPFHDALQDWRSMQAIHPAIKQRLEERGMLSLRPPTPLPHVILLSTKDAWLFAERRWRVFKSPKGSAKKYEVKRKIVSKALHRLVMPEAKYLQFVNNDGTDCRRENLRETTIAEVVKKRAA